MFQNKNNQTTDGNQTDLSQKNDLPLEDLPVHTMKKDLEAIKHPELAKAEMERGESATRPQPINREKLTEAQKSSPFLDFSATQKPAETEAVFRPEIVQPAISDSRIKIVDFSPRLEKTFFTPEKSAPIPEKSTLDSRKNSSEVKQHPHHINFSKVFAGVIIVLVIAIIAGGGYYFWTTRQSTPEVVVIPPVIETETPPAELVAKFLTDKPNTFGVDMAAATSATLKESLKNYAKEVADAKITTPVEFIVAGANGKLVTFKDFAKISGIAFSPVLAANLSDTFSLFIYNDNTVIRTGLVIDSKDLIKLKSLMTLEEKNLAKNISPLFLATDYTLVAKAFAGSDYNGTTIRYMNIISPEDLSVDYAIRNNKLVIGTTKMTLRSIIDYLKSQTK